MGITSNRRSLRTRERIMAVSARPVLLLLFAAGAFAQDRGAWLVQAQTATIGPGGLALLGASAPIQPGWHLYSASSPAGIPATFPVEPGTLVKVFQPPPKKAF